MTARLLQVIEFPFSGASFTALQPRVSRILSSRAFKGSSDELVPGFSDRTEPVFLSKAQQIDTPEQAKLLLLGQAAQGNQRAKDLLDVRFPDPNRLQGKVFPCLEERPGGVVTGNIPRVSRLIVRARMIPESVRQRFMRFVRG